METPRNYQTIIAKLSICKVRSSFITAIKGRVSLKSRFISTNEDQNLRIESFAVINFHGVSKKL